MEYFDHVGISYDGDKINDEPHGFGQMTMQDGSKYTGNFFSGQFHGDGELVFESGGVVGKIVGRWDNGELQEHKIFFGDNLQFESDNWNYLIPSDRRFHNEITGAVPVAASRTEPSQFPDLLSIAEYKKTQSAAAN